MKMIRRSSRSAPGGWTPGASAPAPRLAVSCVTFLLFAGCQQAPSAPQAPSPAAEKKEAGNPTAEAEGVTLKPEEIEKAGIKTTPAAASRHAPEVGGRSGLDARLLDLLGLERHTLGFGGRIPRLL